MHHDAIGARSRVGEAMLRAQPKTTDGVTRKVGPPVPPTFLTSPESVGDIG